MITEQWFYYFIACVLDIFRNLLAAVVDKMSVIKKMGKVSLYIPFFIPFHFLSKDVMKN